MTEPRVYFRPDIACLRAIAIAAALLFHAGVAGKHLRPGHAEQLWRVLADRVEIAFSQA